VAKDLEPLEVQLWIDGLSKGLRSEIRTQAQARHGTAEQAVGAARPRRCPHATWPRLRGTEPSGKAFEEITTTENVIAEGFMCNCMFSLVKGSIVEVILSSRGEHYVGQARVVRKESSGAPWQRYGFQFVEKTLAWPLQ
jgi:hypothetical protein